MWIAFKICIFDFQKQRCRKRFLSIFCCELLSKFVSLTFRNSIRIFIVSGQLVVNCFQNLYLWLSETAFSNRSRMLYMLWIAFKICIFDFQKQLSITSWRLVKCCELLSKFVSLTFRNSLALADVTDKLVVNCFQNLYLWLSETAIAVEFFNKQSLWIAFKICIFDFQKQLNYWSYYWNISCELLSKFVSLTFRNSMRILVETGSHSCELLSKFVSLTFRNSGYA